MFVAARKTILGLALAAGLVLGVSSAQAANVLLNPGFEAQCPGASCHWSPGSNTVIATDTVNPLSGSASLAVTYSRVDIFNPTFSAVSDCVTVSPQATYNLGYWYRTTATNLTSIGLSLDEFTTTDCTDPPQFQSSFLASPRVTTGAWTLLKGQVTTLLGTQSAQVGMDFACALVTCGEADKVNVDDAALQAEPLAVSVGSVSAESVTKGVLVRWRTGTETNLLGFQVYRSHGNSWQRLTRSLIATRGSVSGHSYRFLDRTARRGGSYRYRIKVVRSDGSVAWFGPVRVT